MPSPTTISTAPSRGTTLFPPEQGVGTWDAVGGIASEGFGPGCSGPSFPIPELPKDVTSPVGKTCTWSLGATDRTGQPVRVLLSRLAALPESPQASRRAPGHQPNTEAVLQSERGPLY